MLSGWENSRCKLEGERCRGPWSTHYDATHRVCMVVVGEALRPQGVCSQGSLAVRSMETWMAAWKAVGMLW